MVTGTTRKLKHPMETSGEVAKFSISESLKLLHEFAATAYKEQNDLDESVWRAMPFIAALFGLAVTVIRFVPPHLSFVDGIPRFAASALYVGAMASFVLAFAYFWMVALPRYFETPAKTVEIRDHAAALTIWYESTGKREKPIDFQVADDLRRLMIDQLGNATETNRPVVEKRLAARSRSILLLLAGFAFISFSEMLMFSVNELEFGSVVNGHASATPQTERHNRAESAVASKGNAGAARR